ncbi:DUF6346 domain-containing protein [Micromonospora tarapacensis]|uniref:DUF6346 domain-containing protein n=1 Tax=Micromonospora tarapacensis TaxID=2835305 RepID=UPI002F41E8DC
MFARGDLNKGGNADRDDTGIASISWYGFGYWWSCTVQVKMDDGRMLEIETEGSIIRPGDHNAPIVESCQKNRPAKCVYTQPGNFALAFGVRLLGMVRAAVVVVIGTAAAIAVAIFALIGGRRGDAKTGEGHGWDIVLEMA